MFKDFVVNKESVFPKEFKISHKKLLLKTFRNTLDFLESHNLKYCGAYGTALGAVRHKGMIPWDDDIDIIMPREDYNKFLKLRSEIQSQGYDIVNQEDYGYYTPFAKVVDLNTTLLEFIELPFVTGVFIDIFPVDEFDLPDSELQKMNKRYRKEFIKYMNIIYSYPLSALPKALLSLKRGLSLQIMRCNNPFVNKTTIHKKMIATLKSFEHIGGSKSIYLNSIDGQIVPTRWFKDTIECPFEDFTIQIPKEYDKYLSSCYGDYMTLPPEEKRASHHFMAYFNLCERLTIEEVRERLKKGERFVY